MKKKFAQVTALILVLLMLAACGGTASTAPASSQSPVSSQETPSAAPSAAAPSGKAQIISMATAQLGGGTYNNGLAQVSAANLGMTNYKAEALPTSGAVEAARMLRDNEAEMACVGIDAIYNIYNGKDRYVNDAWKDLRLMYPQFATYVNIMVPKNSSIQKIEDLKGKKVGVGNPGSAGYFLITSILRAHGLMEGDYEEQALSNTEQADALKNGQIDSFGFYTTPNSPAIVELATTLDCRWLSVDEAKWNEYAENNGLPFTVVHTPVGTYKGMDTETLTISGMNFIVTRADVPEEMIYEFTKAFFDNYDEAVKTVAAVADIKNLLPTAEALAPWHPGAEKYFKEAGLAYQEYKS